MYFPEKTSENVVSTVQGVFQQLPQREGDREAVVGVSKVETNNWYDYHLRRKIIPSQITIYQ